MSQRWIGPSVIVAILASVVIFLALNLNLNGPSARKTAGAEPVVTGTSRKRKPSTAGGLPRISDR